MRVVVLGAGGFVGGSIVEDLIRRRDVDLVACVRRWASAVRLARRGIQVQQFDLDEPESVAREVLRGADVVINATMPPAASEASLIGALHATCAVRGVDRLIHLSSAAVYGEQTGNIDESTPPAPTDGYSRGKAATEERLWLAAENGGPKVVMLRPSIIYGPFSDAWTVNYAQRINRGRWLNIGSFGEGNCNLIHASDLALAVYAATTSEIKGRGTVFNVNGPEIVTWNNYIERFGDALNVEGRSTPNLLKFRAAGWAAQTLRFGAKFALARELYRKSSGAARITMQGAQSLTKLYPSPDELRLLGRKARYLSGRAEQSLGFSSSVPLQKGLGQAAAWCSRHGVV